MCYNRDVICEDNFARNLNSSEKWCFPIESVIYTRVLDLTAVSLIVLVILLINNIRCLVCVRERKLRGRYRRFMSFARNNVIRVVWACIADIIRAGCDRNTIKNTQRVRIISRTCSH